MAEAVKTKAPDLRAALLKLLEAHDVVPYGGSCDERCLDMHVNEATLDATVRDIEALFQAQYQPNDPVGNLEGR